MKFLGYFSINEPATCYSVYFVPGHLQYSGKYGMRTCMVWYAYNTCNFQGKGGAN